MPDFRVTFKGDLGNLSQFDSAIKNAAISSERAFRAANTNIASSVGKISGVYDALNSKSGLFVNKQRAVADAVNNTFNESGQIIRRYISGYQAAVDKAGKYSLKPIFKDSYEGDFRRNIGNLQAYERAVERIIPHEKELLGVRRNLARTQVNIGNRRVALSDQGRDIRDRLGSDTRVQNLRAFTLLAEDAYNRAAADLANTPKGTKGITQKRLLVQQTEKEMLDARTALAAARAPFEAEITKVNAAFAKLDTAEQTAIARAGRREGNILRRGAYTDLKAATQATPPVQADLARVLAESQDVRKNLLRAGLGQGTQYGTQDFQRALAQQEAAVTSYTRNLRTNVKTVTGEFKDASGLMSKFTVDLDENNKVIGRWGGQLSGAGSILRQTVRDFQKVIEWTIATTVVFGTLATVVGQLQNINELNTALTRFSITAQTSAAETATFFTDLTRVSIATATPLKELVTVADDIALATREAGDSTDVWKGKILSLTEAVGIFTNLTGKETVAAADQLSSTFKQLDIAPQELVGFLNKVTAVAGGQANAIADIVQSISGLAEAARAAGFTVDEQIAAVQVLAQVTSKTSAEVATAFKNLFGSVSSVGSEKILAEFGINVRDAAGEVRDFLDIYRDVAKALESGIIPQGRLPDVLRGIAGGPRRAPDAAALLSNVGRIDAVVLKSQNATNEALLANAKILDTNQAKIIQFQNAIDAAIFEEFGQAVRELTTSLAEFGTMIARVLGSFDSELVTTALKLALVVTGLLTFQRILGLLGKALGIGGIVNSLRNTSTGFQTVAASATEAAAAMAAADARLAKSGLLLPNGVTSTSVFPPAPTGQKGGIKNFLKNNKLGLAIGAAGIAGAAAGASSGGGLTDLGTLLQVGGTVATLVPGLQAFGIAAAVAGTAIQLFSANTEKAKDNTADLSAEVYTLTQSLQATQDTANEYAKAQASSLETIQKLKAETKLTAVEQSALSDATSTYVTATLGLAEANRQVSATFDDILAKLPALAEHYSSFKNISALSPNDPRIREIQQTLASEILKNTGQGIYAGATVPIAQQFRTGGLPQEGPITVAGFGPGGHGLREQFDLSRLIKTPEDLGKLFGIGTALKAEGPLPTDDVSIRIIQSALNELLQQFREGTGVLSEEELDKLVIAVTALSEQGSSFTQNATALAQLSAQIQSRIATGEFTGREASNATTSAALAERLNQGASRYRQQTPTGAFSPDRPRAADPIIEENIRLIQQLTQAAEEGATVSNSLFEKVAINGLKINKTYEDLASIGEQALHEGIVQWLKEAGASQEVLDALAKGYNLTLQQTKETAEEVALSFANARDKARESYADRSLQLLIAENSGQYEENAKGLQMLQEQNKQAYSSSIALIDALSQLSQTSMVELNNSLSNVIGLQGQFITEQELSSLTAEQLAEKVLETSNQMIENAVAAGVNSEGIAKLRAKVLELIGAIIAIPPYRKVIIEVQTILNKSSALQLGSGDFGKELQTKINQATILQKKAEATGTDYVSQINKIINQINKIIAGGVGSSLGGTTSSGGGGGGGGGGGLGGSSYNPPGLLDIPPEVLLQSNGQQLLQQAIAKAKKLQSQVPGATGANRGEIVELLNGTKRILEVRGVGEEFLRRAMDELRDEIKKQNDLLSKADSIRRIRVGGGDFSAIANVPINSKSGVSVGGLGGPISVSLDVNGTVFTPAQLSIFADMVAASLKRQLAG